MSQRAAWGKTRHAMSNGELSVGGIHPSFCEKHYCIDDFQSGTGSKSFLNSDRWLLIKQLERIVQASRMHSMRTLVRTLFTPRPNPKPYFETKNAIHIFDPWQMLHIHLSGTEASHECYLAAFCSLYLPYRDIEIPATTTNKGVLHLFIFISLQWV